MDAILEQDLHGFERMVVSPDLKAASLSLHAGIGEIVVVDRVESAAIGNESKAQNPAHRSGGGQEPTDAEKK